MILLCLTLPIIVWLPIFCRYTLLCCIIIVGNAINNWEYQIDIKQREKKTYNYIFI